ncbi:Clp protease-related protein, chloroplastic [Capsicum annuum]|uniref:Clp protease-related protein, chloroplastic n=1 Tax=Capsicum annuum TaxID=4072 RepID=A0A2G2ZYR9_CAPAN|nr:Clp protease-related protein, chloroplastic [Capsicum annuum]
MCKSEAGIKMEALWVLQDSSSSLHVDQPSSRGICRHQNLVELYKKNPNFVRVVLGICRHQNLVELYKKNSNSVRVLGGYSTSTLNYTYKKGNQREPLLRNSPSIWSARAIKAFAFAELEARKLKYPNTGTEALLMGILVEGSSSAAKFLRTNGVTLFKVRDEIVKLLGRSDMYYFSPEHPPLTKTAQKALDWAIDEKLKSGEGGEITVTHLALGIWSEKESAGHKIMATLGFDDDKAKELTKFMDKDIEMLYN